jgi:hypothetical protein
MVDDPAPCVRVMFKPEIWGEERSSMLPVSSSGNITFSAFTDEDIEILKKYSVITGKIWSDEEWYMALRSEIDKFDFSTNSIMHGDFCFSNILYDFRSQSIKVIDPRGIDNEGEITIYGDILYDITKLAHSIIGLYDFIIAGYYEINIESENQINFQINISDSTKEIQQFFLNIKFNGQTIKHEFYINQLVHLFLSMLPLHSENIDRQYALMSNALRLYLLKNELNGK